jgi:hypothetical protein
MMSMMAFVMLVVLAPVLVVMTMVIPMTPRRRVIIMHRMVIIMVHDPVMVVIMARDRGTNRHTDQAAQQGILGVGLGRACHHQSCRERGTNQNLFHNLLLESYYDETIFL